MSDKLRTIGLDFVFNGKNGITGIDEVSRALRDEAQTVKELSKVLGDNGTVTARNQQTKKEFMRDIRRSITQSEAAKRKTENLTRAYKHQAAIVNKTADEQEVLNAVYKLGAHATEKQQMETAQLVNAYQRVRKETTKTQKGFRNLRGVSQNLG